jgi:hypothetical protein
MSHTITPQTQEKVKKLFPSCEHVLFDVAPDMSVARKQYRVVFNEIGKDFPQHREVLIAQAARYMVSDFENYTAFVCYKLYCGMYPIAKRLQKNANLLQSDYKANGKRLRSDCRTIAKRIQRIGRMQRRM